ASDDRRAVGAAVVGDYHLGRDPQLLGCALRFLDAAGDGLGLVQAGHDDRNLDGGAFAGVPALLNPRGDLHAQISLTAGSSVSPGSKQTRWSLRPGSSRPSPCVPPSRHSPRGGWEEAGPRGRTSVLTRESNDPDGSPLVDWHRPCGL